jgi:hypothetical protein
LKEPSVLDYVKARLAFWRGAPPPIPPVPPEILEEEFQPTTQTKSEQTPVSSPKPTPYPRAHVRGIRLPAFTLIALFLALVAQSVLEPPSHLAGMAIVLYSLAAFSLLLGLWRDETAPATLPAAQSSEENYHVLLIPLIIGGVFAVVSFYFMGDDLFTQSNVIAWLTAIFGCTWAFWPTNAAHSQSLAHLWTFITRPQWNIKVTRWVVMILALSALIIFFRVYRLNQVPPEMVSDHAEKLLDIGDVLNGQTSIFFPRNTGREGFQMYLTASIILLFHTGLTFLSLKIGTVLAGLVTLPFIFLLGKELGNRETGLIAVAFAGIAYWPNVIARIALRFTLYPLFTAPALYFLVRGLRTSRRRDFILSGLFLGLGLHGYSPFRVVPIVVVITLGLYLLHSKSASDRKHALFGLFIITLISAVIFIPLARYALGHPEMFSYRTMTRLGSLEKPLDAPAWLIFLKNLWRALIMFAWDDGEVWVVSIPHRPALSLVSAALFYMGVVLVIVRYWRNRNWQDLFLLFSVPLLMMPSILSLAFPNENPILNRTAGAIIPVFIIVGIALDAILSAIRKTFASEWGLRFAWVLGICLFAWSAKQDYQLVFQKYQQEYTLSAWNTSEMGKIIKSFSESIGTPDSAWVVGYPYWVDTRLVGVNAGYPSKDYAIWPDHFGDTLSDPNAKLFLINPEDTESMQLLRQLYPLGSLKVYTSRVEGKNFEMFFVPSYDSSP